MLMDLTITMKRVGSDPSLFEDISISPEDRARIIRKTLAEERVRTTYEVIKKSSWHKHIGNTTFTESRNLASKIPCERLYLKFEGNNPTGTQKDRIAFAIAEYAKLYSSSAITTATSGNFGVALAYAAYKFDMKAYIYIPKGYHISKERLKMMEDCKAEVKYVDGYYEDAVLYSQVKAKQNNWFNANPGMEESTEIALHVYSEIAYEIYRALHKAPGYIICPVGNGTTLAGIYLGFKELFTTQKISMIPRMIAVSTQKGNPIIKSFKQKSRIIMDLDPKEIVETKINESLTSWHSFDGQKALDAIYESNGFAEFVTDTKMSEFSKIIKQEEGLNVLPASASTLAVLATLTKNDIALKGTYVAILTGRES